MEDTTEQEVLLTFKPAGIFAQDLVGKLDDDSEVYYDLISLKPRQKISTDAVIGIQIQPDVNKILVLRKTNKTEQYTYCAVPNVYISFVSHTDRFEGMFIGTRFAIQCKDISLLDPLSEDFCQHDRQTLGMIKAAHKNYIIWCEGVRQEDSFNTGRTLKPAFDPPIYLGDYDHEIKDPREATDIWVSGLNLNSLIKTGNGKVGYERFISNENKWKNCNSWTEVLEAATEESGLDIRKEFWHHPDKFPTILARGKKAFISRRDKRKADALEAPRKKACVVIEE
jgi:hypothetical protein